LEIGRKPVLERQALEQGGEGRRIDIVHEPDLGAALDRSESLVLQRHQRLAAEARAAAAHDDDVLERRKALGVRPQCREIVAPRRQAEQRQRAVLLPLANLVEGARGPVELALERGARQARLADRVLQSIVDELRVEHVRTLRDLTRRLQACRRRPW
jgi:hypothetical protein